MKKRLLSLILVIALISSFGFQTISLPVGAVSPDAGEVSKHALVYDFTKADTKHDFTNYYGVGGRFDAIAPTPFEQIWTLEEDGIKHIPFTGENPTILYLNDIKVKYFEAEITMKFNTTNGFPGFVFGAETLAGWGAFNNLVYIMADQPANPASGTMESGLVSTPLNIGLGGVSAPLTGENFTGNNKTKMHTYRIRVTEGLFELFVEGSEAAVISQTINDAALTESPVGLHTMSADVTFGSLKLTKLTKSGEIQPFFEEPETTVNPKARKYDFDNTTDSESFMSYFGPTWHQTVVEPSNFSDHWKIENGALKRKKPIVPLSDTSILYLRNFNAKYFEAEFTMKFNAQNGLPGLVFGANKFDGWGGYNNTIYVMTDQPANSAVGGVVAELNQGGTTKKTVDITSDVGMANKQQYQKYKVRVTEGLVVLYLNDNEILSCPVDDSALSAGRIGLQTVGADVQFGYFSVTELSKSGEYVSYDAEPEIAHNEKARRVDFLTDSDLSDFTTFYEKDLFAASMVKTPTADLWLVSDGVMTRKPLDALSDATVSYLNDSDLRYFEATFTMKFNSQNGLPGLVFGASNFAGWGGFNSVAYFMAGDPQNPQSGDVQSVVSGAGIIESAIDLSASSMNNETKHKWHTYKVRVTKGKIDVYLDGNSTPIQSVTVDDSAIKTGKIGFQTIGADVSYGALSVVRLSENGEELDYLAQSDEPVINNPEKGVSVNFSSESDKEKFTNYYASTMSEKTLKETEFDKNWQFAEGEITRKKPVTPMSDATVLYLDNYAPRYFETVFNMKFNTQNGLAGLVFGSNTPDGWGGYSSFLYFMADQPQNPYEGAVEAGICGLNLGLELGQFGKNITGEYGISKKNEWHQVRVKVTKGKIEVFLDGNVVPIISQTVDENKIVGGKIGLSTVGADISFGGISLQALNENGGIVPIESVIINEDEPALNKPAKGAVWNFDDSADVNQFTNYYGNEWQALTIKKSDFASNWAKKDGAFNRKKPVAPLGDPTQLYLNEYLFTYFEAKFNVKFNDQNGIAGLIFGANNLTGWGGFNSHVYLMADNPSDAHVGDATVGLCGVPLGLDIGKKEVVVNDQFGAGGKQRWHQVTVRVTKNLIEVFVDGGETPVLTQSVTDEQIRAGKIGLSTVGADISFGGLSVQLLDEKGNLVELEKVLKPNDEPILAERSKATLFSFENPEDLNKYTAYYGATWMDKILKKEKSTTHWEISDGILNRKTPIAELSDASVLYLSDQKIKYFDVVFSMKFNAQNGIPGIVFSAHDLEGWGGYNSHAYFMADQPQNMFAGSMETGICGLNFDLEIGSTKADYLKNVGLDRKAGWNVYRVRVTKDNVKIFVNDLTAPVLSKTVDPERVVKGLFGLTTVGADISFGDVQMQLLDVNGNPISSDGFNPTMGQGSINWGVIFLVPASLTLAVMTLKKRRKFYFKKK